RKTLCCKNVRRFIFCAPSFIAASLSETLRGAASLGHCDRITLPCPTLLESFGSATARHRFNTPSGEPIILNQFHNDPAPRMTFLDKLKAFPRESGSFHLPRAE